MIKFKRVTQILGSIDDIRMERINMNDINWFNIFPYLHIENIIYTHIILPLDDVGT